MENILICANKLLTHDLINLDVFIDMLCVTQKILSYMPRDKNMTMSFALIYYIDIDITKCIKVLFMRG